MKQAFTHHRTDFGEKDVVAAREYPNIVNRDSCENAQRLHTSKKKVENDA
jgi:hypothetical protein